jgi:hypothetical protein
MFQPDFRNSLVGLYPASVYEAQQETNIAAGYQAIKMAAVHDTPLAVVGGGPSIKKHIDELVNWPGHIWGINQSAQWLMQFEPRAPVWMFTCDPDPRCAAFADGVDRAILGGCCHPDVFEKFKGKDVRYFWTQTPKSAPKNDELDEPIGDIKEPKTPIFGSASVTRTFYPALLLGYKDVTYFGCEGSIDQATLESNACRSDYEMGFRDPDNARFMVIEAGGVEYITTPDYYITTLHLAEVMRSYPKLKEKSGGLLRAMLKHEDWSCVAVSDRLKHAFCEPDAKPYTTQFRGAIT